MHLFLVTLIVEDYDEALDYFCGVLGFSLVEDTPVSDEKRWVVISPSEKPGGAQILLARAATLEQRGALGDQHGGRVGFFLHTDDFDETYDRFKAQGVRFCETPRSETYGKVVVFKDLYGNKWDLIERA